MTLVLALFAGAWLVFYAAAFYPGGMNPTETPPLPTVDLHQPAS